MRTFTFITYEAPSADGVSYDMRSVILRGELHGNNMVGATPLRNPNALRHLNRFVEGRCWAITDIHQVDMPDLPAALDWVSQCTPLYRNGKVL